MKSNQFNDLSIRFTIWETRRIERFSDLPPSCYLNKELIMIVFDLSNRKSFDNVDLWFSRAKNKSHKSTFFVLIGNKSDLLREVNEEEARQKAKMLGIAYMETSAKTGDNAYLAFKINSEEAVHNIRQNYDKLDSQKY